MSAPRLPTPDDLRLPLRDLVRGARRTLALPETMLKPALEMLPGPVGEVLQKFSKLLPDPDPGADPPSRADLAVAAAGLDGTGGRGAARAFARLLSHATERVLDPAGDGTLMISETLAALAYGDLEPGDPFDNAARLWLALDRGHVIAVAPGTGIATGSGDRIRIDAACHAMFLWLLCERPQAEGEEDEILALCAAFAAATADQRAAALGDAERLAALLVQNARLI